MVAPIDLVRLRTATAMYVAILYDSLPALETLTSPDCASARPGAELMACLRESVEAALDIDDAPGTPAAILTTLCHLLGLGTHAAGAGVARGSPSASMMQVHQGNGIVDEGAVESNHRPWTY
jgi:hypothetical protein